MVRHYNWRAGLYQETMSPWPESGQSDVPVILITSGASCPDASVDRVMQSILRFYSGARIVEDVLMEFEQRHALKSSATGVLKLTFAVDASTPTSIHVSKRSHRTAKVLIPIPAPA